MTMEILALDSVANPTLPEHVADVPYLEQYFGCWVMVEDRFRALADHARRLDLHVHLTPEIKAEARAAADRQRKYQTTADGIAVVNLTGTLMKHVSSFSRGTSTVMARQAIRAAVEDPAVRALVINIDSPGGTVSGANDLGDEIHAARQQKPTWGYIEDIGASGGYWQAAQTAQLWAGAAALVGSIGTYGVVQDYSARASQMGVKVHVIRAGKMKGVGVEGAEITAEHLADLQREINDLNDIFLQAVARGRGDRLPLAKVREVADGTLHVGLKAVEKGLIDHVGSFESMLTTLRNSLEKKTMSKSSTAKADSSTTAAVTVQTTNDAPPDKDKQADSDKATMIAATANAQLLSPEALAEIDKRVASAQVVAQADERKRCSEIRALCDQAKRPNLAGKFIEAGTPVAEVQSTLFKAICEDNPGVGDTGSGDSLAEKKDPDKEFKQEYAAAREQLAAQGIDEAAYVQTRRIDEGLDPITVLFKPPSKSA